MAEFFKIDLTNKPSLYELQTTDKQAFMKIIGTFVSLMEVAAKDEWYKLPETIHTSLSFEDIVVGVLNAVMNTEAIEPTAYATLEQDLHPLGLLSDQRNNLITGEREVYDWRSHFVMKGSRVNRDTLEKIIRKLLYLVRWIDIETVSKTLLTREFQDIHNQDIGALAFQPALMYQKEHLGELFVGKFFHDIGAFDCGKITYEQRKICPACNIGELQDIHDHRVCPRCNAGFDIITPE